jgi:hypothetical protein
MTRKTYICTNPKCGETFLSEVPRNCIYCHSAAVIHAKKKQVQKPAHNNTVKK